MGVSFKVSRDGTRFRHKAIRSDVAPEDGSDDNENSRLPGEYELNSIGSRKLEVFSVQCISICLCYLRASNGGFVQLL